MFNELELQIENSIFGKMSFTVDTRVLRVCLARFPLLLRRNKWFLKAKSHQQGILYLSCQPFTPSEKGWIRPLSLCSASNLVRCNASRWIGAQSLP